MTATANGKTVTELTLSAPTRGAWTADVVVDAERLDSRVVLMIGGMAWLGTVARSGAHSGRIRARVVGGAGKLGAETTLRFFVAATLRVIIEETLRAAGETLSSTVDAALMATAVSRWTRPAATVAASLDALAAAFGATWRLEPGGAVWFGRETWPASSATSELLDADGADGVELRAVESTAILPGQALGGRPVGYVTYVLSARELRAHVAFVDAGTHERVRGALDALMARALAPTALLARWPGAVLRESGGALDVKVDTDRVPGVATATARMGLPGTTLEGVAGQRACVAFAGGDPRAPYVAEWESGGTAHIGTLLVVTTSGAVALLQWFPAGAVGSAAAQAAAAAANVPPAVATLLPLTVPVWSLSPPPAFP